MQYIIIFVISIFLWYYYTQYKEKDNKYIPMMIRQSELLEENEVLKEENTKLKSKIKYLELYKNDVSKTFKILDNELEVINEHLKNKQGQRQQHQEQNVTSMNPGLLNSLFNHIQNNPTESPFNHIQNNPSESLFNQLVTSDMLYESDEQQEQTEQEEQEHPKQQEQEQEQHPKQQEQEHPKQEHPKQEHPEQEREHPKQEQEPEEQQQRRHEKFIQSQVVPSFRSLPLNSHSNSYSNSNSYTRYLINHDLINH